MHDPRLADTLRKVPSVVLSFWLLKIIATTLGETGGDALSMSLNLGYAASTLIYLAFFGVMLFTQVSSRRMRPFVYWGVVVATTTVGTTFSDYLDRTLELGYVVSSCVLFAGVLMVLFAWKRTTGAVQFENIVSRTDELFYWITILVANTLGTALGDFVASTAGIGFELGALVFGALIVFVAAAHLLTRIPKSVLFWSAYVLTRPFGATLGDTLTKPLNEGGLNLDRITSSLVLVGVMIAGVAVVQWRGKFKSTGA